MYRILATLAVAAGAVDAFSPFRWNYGALTRRPVLASTQSAGCASGNVHNPGYHNDNKTHHIVSGGKDRYYAVQVPDGYEATTSYPLIFDYHGNTDTPDDQHNNSQYYLDPKGKDYIVVYPQGYYLSWQGPSYAYPGIDDLTFTSDLLKQINGNYCIDTNRIYASGKSNGGGFVDTLACSDNGDAFAAFAMASAALYTDTSEGSCSKTRAILESHGDVDGVIPYGGGQGKGGSLPSIKSWVSWWGQRDCGTSVKAVNSGDLGGYNTTSYSCHNQSDVVMHYQIFDLGHCWPSTTGENYDALNIKNENCATDKVLNYTQKVTDFFGKWDLTNAPSQ